MSDESHTPIADHPADVAGLRAALAEAHDAAAAAPPTPPSVDAGWRSRKLIVGVIFGGLVIGLASFLMLVAATGLFLPDLPDKLVVLVVRFEPVYWLSGTAAGLVFIAICVGLVQVDKLIDLVRDLIPVLKARYGVKT